MKDGWVVLRYKTLFGAHKNLLWSLALQQFATREWPLRVKQIGQASPCGISWRVSLNRDAKATCCVFIQKWEQLHLFPIAGILRVATAPGKSRGMQGTSSSSLEGLKTLKKHPGTPVLRLLRWE